MGVRKNSAINQIGFEVKLVVGAWPLAMAQNISTSYAVQKNTPLPKDQNMLSCTWLLNLKTLLLRLRLRLSYFSFKPCFFLLKKYQCKPPATTANNNKLRMYI